MLAADVVWHEFGEGDYASAHRGRDEIVELLERLVGITDGTFTLEPSDFITTAEHVATNVRWSEERNDTSVEGNDLGVYRVAEGQIACEATPGDRSERFHGDRSQPAAGRA
jgi:hypothetical protein